MFWILWAIPILVIALLVALVRLPDEWMKAEISRVSKQTSLPYWNDARVWQYGLLLAGSIVAFFVINAFVGTILRSLGETFALAGLLFAFNATPLLASFTMLAAP